MNRLQTPSFPNTFIEPFIITSPQTEEYNCIAWAYEDNEAWYWPDNDLAYWPDNIPNTLEVNSFVELYRSIGYEITDNEQYEEGFLKVAIYTKNGIPQHAARQINAHYWTSKLGKEFDISHTIFSMSDGAYGNVTVFMKRAIS